MLLRRQERVFKMDDDFKALHIVMSFDQGEMQPVDNSKHQCADLSWVSVAQAHQETLAEICVSHVTCTASGWLVWRGNVNALPKTMHESRCGSIVAAWRGEGADRDLLLLDMPWPCRAWIQHGENSP